MEPWQQTYTIYACTKVTGFSQILIAWQEYHFGSLVLHYIILLLVLILFKTMVLSKKASRGYLNLRPSAEAHALYLVEHGVHVVHLNTDHIPEPDKILGHDGKRVRLVPLLQYTDKTITNR